MEDTKIIDLYFARDEQALTETDRKYGRYCFTLADAILKRREDSEEVVNDTYWKAWEAIPPKRPAILKLFLAKITRNLAFTRWRSETAEKRGGSEMEAVLDELEDCIPASGGLEEAMGMKELTLAIRKFLDTQKVREQNIFLRRYFYVEETEAIAARYGMRPDAVRRSLSRTRAKLKTYLMQEGFAV